MTAPYDRPIILTNPMTIAVTAVGGRFAVYAAYGPELAMDLQEEVEASEEKEEAVTSEEEEEADESEKKEEEANAQ